MTQPAGDPRLQAIGPALQGAAAIADVRSPAEYAKGHIAGAINIPLFSNNERAEIGTLYKALGKDEAIQQGLALMGTRLGDFVAAFAPYKHAPLLVYCARGGMRSQAVVGLLAALGYRVQQLPGGYKAFRNYLLGELERALPPRLIVLHGQTGVGKTLLLRRLANGLDLEDCAQHRSSVFGAVGLQPRTQQQFDAELLAALGRLDSARPVWVEGESRKIGDVTMPDALRRRMGESPCVLVTAALDTRVERILAAYGAGAEAPLAEWEAALRSLAAPLGRARVEDMAARLRRGEVPGVVRELLLDYYDPRYAHSMRNYRYALTVDSDDLDAALRALEAFAVGQEERPAAPAAPGRGGAARHGAARRGPARRGAAAAPGSHVGP
jgi:tRNA 2-selenouridine synthase